MSPGSYGVPRRLDWRHYILLEAEIAFQNWLAKDTNCRMPFLTLDSLNSEHVQSVGKFCVKIKIFIPSVPPFNNFQLKVTPLPVRPFQPTCSGGGAYKRSGHRTKFKGVLMFLGFWVGARTKSLEVPRIQIYYAKYLARLLNWPDRLYAPPLEQWAGRNARVVLPTFIRGTVHHRVESLIGSFHGSNKKSTL